MSALPPIGYHRAGVVYEKENVTVDGSTNMSRQALLSVSVTTNFERSDFSCGADNRAAAAFTLACVCSSSAAALCAAAASRGEVVTEQPPASRQESHSKRIVRHQKRA